MTTRVIKEKLLPGLLNIQISVYFQTQSPMRQLDSRKMTIWPRHKICIFIYIYF